MNENKNILKLVIPVVAMVIIFESVVLVNDLLNKKQTITGGTVTRSEVITDVSNNQMTLDLVFGTETKEMVVGKVYPVELNMLSSTVKSFDSMSLYIKYDASAFEVTSLTSDSKLPKPYFSKISTQKNLIVMNYLIQDPVGYKVEANDTLALVKFNVKPKKAGSFNFEINTGIADKESATMFIENATSKVLPFSSNKLTVTSTTK